MHASIPVLFLVPTSENSPLRQRKISQAWFEHARILVSIKLWLSFWLVNVFACFVAWGSWYDSHSFNGELMGFTQPNFEENVYVRCPTLGCSLQLPGRWNWRRGTKLTWFVSERHWFTHIYLTRDSIFLRDSKNLWCLRIPIKANQKWRNLNQNSVHSQTHTSLKSSQCSFEKNILRVSFFSGSLGSSLGYQGNA